MTDAKLEWMYKDSDKIVDREEYLLGKRIDKAVENQDTSSVTSTIPNSLLSTINEIYDNVDAMRKIKEDPLEIIREKEIQMRKELLKNPVQMKKLKQLIEKQKRFDKKQKTEKKKKKQKLQIDKSESEDALNEMLTRKFKYLVSKIGKDAVLNMDLKETTKKKEVISSSEESCSEEEVQKNTRKKYEANTTSSDSEDGQVNKKNQMVKGVSFETRQFEDKKKYDKEGNRFKKNDLSKMNRYYNVSEIGEEEKRKEIRSDRLYKRKNDDGTKNNQYQKKSGKMMCNSQWVKTEKTSEERKRYVFPDRCRNRDRSDKQNYRKRSKDKLSDSSLICENRGTEQKKRSWERISSSPDLRNKDEPTGRCEKKIMRRSIDKCIRKNKYGGNKSSYRSRSPLRRSRSYETTNGKQKYRIYKETDYKIRSEDRSSEREQRTSKWTKNSPKKNTNMGKSGGKSYSRKKESRKETSSRNENKSAEKERFKEQESSSGSEQSSSSSSRDSDISPYKNKTYGLEVPKGAVKAVVDVTDILKKETQKPVQVKPAWKNKKNTRMTSEERERKLKEMVENVSWRDDFREKNIKLYKQEDEIERKTSAKYDDNFARKELVKAASSSTVESRIKSKLHNIQRSSFDMDTNFAKKCV